ncbi:hypothetical protein [Geobacillus subterraneus]|uniref:Uncharacterized protein n=1 Tax=Geobacillus subterraneus TaxID=129338 RepID=A0A679G1K2_9BACL|nr:hypothetical protein [Geobacillus subterraneus]BBW98974.1 hypothetical protein GsuE55_38070 [Geobacillus subterraneus]
MNMKNEKQMIRLDGTNVFVEVMNDTFEIGKVRFHFVEYDATKPKKERIQKSISIYVDISSMLCLIHDGLSGELRNKATQAREEAERTKSPCKEVWMHLGGVSAETLAKRNQSRPDGMALARRMRLIPGKKKPWVLVAEMGAGREFETGLIAMTGKPEVQIMVPLSEDDFKALLLVTQAHIQGYISSFYGQSGTR